MSRLKWNPLKCQAQNALKITHEIRPIKAASYLIRKTTVLTKTTTQGRDKDKDINPFTADPVKASHFAILG